MNRFAELTDQAKAVLLQGQPEKLGDILNANFDLRRTDHVPIQEDYLEDDSDRPFLWGLS